MIGAGGTGAGGTGAGQPTLRDRRRAELRDRIVAAALPLFAEHGFDAVTVEEIAAAAGISLSTLFRHVPGKDDLLVDVVRTGRARIVANFEQRPAAEPASRSLAHAILRRTEQFSDETQTIELWRRAMASAPPRIRRAALLDEDERARLTGLVAARLPGVDSSGRAATAGDPAADELTPGVLVHVMLAAAEYALPVLAQPAGRAVAAPAHAAGAGRGRQRTAGGVLAEGTLDGKSPSSPGRLAVWGAASPGRSRVIGPGRNGVPAALPPSASTRLRIIPTTARPQEP